MNNTLLDIFLPYQQKFFLDSHKRKIWIASRQIGKSFCAAGMLVATALMNGSNGLSLCISVNSRSASEILKKCAQFAEAVKQLTNSKLTYDSAYDHITFSNGARVMSLPSTSDSLRGWSIRGSLLIDEFCFIRNLEDILQGIAPTLTRSKDSQLVLCSTPAGKNGYGYEIYQQALNSEEWYVQQTTINDAISDGLNVNVDNLKSLCLDPDVFRQEYECCFLDSFGSMLDINELQYFDELPKDAKTSYLGVDVGRTHDNTSILIAKTLKDIIYVDDIIVLNKVDYQTQLQTLKNLNEKQHFRAGLIDSGGIGNAVAEFANRQISSKIKGLQFSATNKTKMYENIVDKVLQRKLMFNKKFQKIIEDDFRNVQKIITPDGTVKFTASRNEAGHSDIISALALLLEAVRTNPLNASAPVTYMPFSVF